MHNFWLPYLLIMAHFLSGAAWLILINRKAEPFAAKEQWIKYIVYLLLFNVLWHSIVWYGMLFTYMGYLITIAAIYEWIHAIKKLPYKTAWILGFLLITAGFWRFLYLEKAEIIFAYFIVILFDGASQITGQLFGKTPLAPKISPRKTVEGLLGGIAVTLATAFLVKNTFSFSTGRLLLSACLILLAAFAGDMMASLLKRNAGINRFGKLLPGHGGVLDRFDSLIMTGFVVYMYTLIAGPWN